MDLLPAASEQHARKKKDRKHTEENAMSIHAITKMLYINSSNQRQSRQVPESLFLFGFFLSSFSRS
jgi:hypothetical protein